MGDSRVQVDGKSSSTLTPGFKPEESSFLKQRYQDRVEEETTSPTAEKQLSTSGQTTPTPPPSDPPPLSHSFGQMSVLPIQAKLTIGQPNDKYEQEADRVAEQVMRMPDPRSPAAGITRPVISPVVQRVCSECEEELQRQPMEEREEEEEPIQTKPITVQMSPLVQKQAEEQEEEEILQTKPLVSQITPLVQRQSESLEEEEKEEETLQPKPTPGQNPIVSSNLQARITNLQGGGQSLPQANRALFESRFGTDFSHVRLHTDRRAAETARAISARAFTSGRNIVFGAGQYQPESTEGQRLLAHELTHVVQQTGAKPLVQRSKSEAPQETATTQLAQVLQIKPLGNQIIHPIQRKAEATKEEERISLSDIYLQRACDTSPENIAECTQAFDISIFDVASTGESLFLFDDDCNLLPEYTQSFEDFALSIPSDTSIEIHGFSSEHELEDFSCPRALKAGSLLMERGVSPGQVSKFFAHSGVPGPLEQNRSVIINLVGSRHAAVESPSSQEHEKEESRPEGEQGLVQRPVTLPGFAGSEKISTEYLETGWESVNQLGIVRVEEPGAKEKGAYLRRDASTAKTPLHLLEENAKVFVIAKNMKTRWVYVNVVNKQNRGSFGYIASHLIWSNLPDPDAVLYYVKDKGEGLQKLVENHEQYKDYDIKTGDDARSIIMAVHVANEQDRRTRGHVYINNEKLEKAQDPSTLEKLKDYSDEYRRVLRPIIQSVELQQGEKIWLPGKSYIESLKDKGIIPTRPEWKNVAIAVTKGIGGFVAGLMDGFLSSVLDIFVGIYELIKDIISLVIDIISGEAIRAAQEIYDLIDSMSAEEILALLKKAVVGLFSEIFNNFVNQWKAENTYRKWYFRGKVIGYILAEVLILLLTGGAANATKWLGKLGKIGSKLEKILNTGLRNAEKIAKKVTPRRKTSKLDVEEPAPTGSKEAKEWPAALSLAKTFTEAHDKKNSSTTVLKASLRPLKRKFSWIDRFETPRISPGHYKVLMIGSKYVVDEDYDIREEPDNKIDTASKGDVAKAEQQQKAKAEENKETPSAKSKKDVPAESAKPKKEKPEPADPKQAKLKKLEEELAAKQEKLNTLRKTQEEANSKVNEELDKIKKYRAKADDRTLSSQERIKARKKWKEAHDRWKAAAEKNRKLITDRDNEVDELNKLRREVDLAKGKVNFERHSYSDSGKIEPCFPPGTIVKTPIGDRPIESLVKGDVVFAYDFTSNMVVEQSITQIHQNWTLHLVDIGIENEILTTTRMHSFWVQNSHDWLYAKSLRKGMVLQSIQRNSAKVKFAKTYSFESVTYNLQVSQCHNYFVGETGILVHNGDDKSDFAKTRKVQTEIYAVYDQQGNIKYVGKTVQGMDTRFGQHTSAKEHWKELGYRIGEKPLKSGNWTPYETAVWEQHFIDKHGGAKSQKPNTLLENKDRAITEDKYNQYKKGYGHNPC